MADISLTPQADDLAVIDAVAPMLRESFPLSVLAADPCAVAPEFWKEVAGLGWPIAALDEERGGAGFDLAQDMLMNREYGRHLAPVSLLSTAVGIRLLTELNVETEALIEGRERVGFAAFIDDGRTGETISGALHLIDAEADRFLLVDAEGAAVFDRDAISSATAMRSVDPTVSLMRATLDDAVVRFLPAAQSDLPLRAQLLIAAQLTGIALAASEMAAEYAKVREQFGKPIGAFQAVAHLCVDAAVRARASDAQVAVAALALRDGWRDARLQVSAAALLAAGAAFLAGTNNIQVHGGMGYSAESGAHLYLKRSVLLRRLLPFGESPADVLLAAPLEH